MDEQNSSDFDFPYVFIVNGIKTTEKGRRSYTVGIFSQVHYAVYIAEQEVNYHKGDLICNVMKMPLDNVIQKEEQVKIVYSAKYEEISEKEETDFDWDPVTENDQDNRDYNIQDTNNQEGPH
jgi:hypothetical protein